QLLRKARSSTNICCREGPVTGVIRTTSKWPRQRDRDKCPLSFKFSIGSYYFQ
ncbi:hypothetical protein J6590_006515, partial [Homalodisca vitripennis]